MVLTLKQFSQTWWHELCRKVKKSVVFIDNESAESLHWNGGVMELMSAGALGVKEFSSFENGQPNHKKAVFISCSPIFDISEAILRDIIQNSSFEYCVIVSAAHPSVQQIARGGENPMATLQTLEDNILQWMGNVNYTVEIFYMPLFIAPITEYLFVTPAFKGLFPEIIEVDESFEQLSLHHLVSCLHSWFTQLDVREFIYSLGPLSGVLASHLAELPAAVARRKTAVNRASVILIDRTLDICTVVKHNADSLLDRILSVLPRLPNHTNDIAVNMSAICNAKVTSVIDDIYLTPGCLSQSNSDICPQVMDWLVNKKQKDVMLALSQHLLTLSPSAKTDRSSSRITPHSLEKQVAAFRGNKDIISLSNGILQQTLAVTQTLKSSKCAHLDMLTSLEMLQDQQGETALTQIMQLINTRHERKLSIDDLLCLLVHLYSGSDVVFPDSEETELELLLTEALFEDRKNLTGGLAKLIDESSDESIISDYATQICDKLKCLPSERYESLRDGYGLMQQLITDLFSADRPDIPELHSKSTALTDILKSGFNLFLNKPTSKHPLDNPQLIIFVVGGISAREVRIVQEVVSNSELSINVLIGGTRMLTPSDTVHAVLINSLTKTAD